MKTVFWLQWVVIVALSAVVAFGLHEINASRAAGRKAYLATWHKFICKAEQATLASPRATAAQKVAATKFYDGALVDIGAQPCRLNPPM